MNKTISHPQKKTKRLKTLERLTESGLDAEYGLCSSFLKHTSDQLFQK